MSTADIVAAIDHEADRWGELAWMERGVLTPSEKVVDEALRLLGAARARLRLDHGAGSDLARRIEQAAVAIGVVLDAREDPLRPANADRDRLIVSAALALCAGDHHPPISEK